MTTINGYGREELMKDIEINMTKKKYEKVCCQMAEICSCRCWNIIYYISFLCSYFSKYCMHGNMWLPRRLVTCIKEIMGMRSHGRTLKRNEKFQKLICEMTMLLSVTPLKTHSRLNNPKYANYINLVEPLLYQEAAAKHKRVVDDLFWDTLTPEVRRLFSLLYYLVKTGQKKELVVLLNYLTAAGMEGVIRMPKRVPEDGLQGGYGDMVWQLWHLVFTFVVDTAVAEYLENLWTLFGFKYKQCLREERLNLLFMAFMAVMNPKALEDKPVKDPVVKAACEKIGLAFADVIKVDVAAGAESKRKGADASVPNNETSKASDKLKYLWSYAYLPDNE